MNPPDVLIALDPDWLQCDQIYQSPEIAAEAAKHLEEELGWSCPIDSLYRYELQDWDHESGVATYWCRTLSEMLELAVDAGGQTWRESL